MTEEAQYIVRRVTPEDMPMITAWAQERGGQIIPALLSPHGFLCERHEVATGATTPLMVIWAYMILDVPVIQLSGLYAAPQTSISDIRCAWQSLQSAVLAWVRELNASSDLTYCILRCFLNKRAVPEAVRTGWLLEPAETLQCLYHVL